MSKYTKYKLYQKYETRGSQEAIPCYPNVFSIDGDGTMPLVIVEENSRDCGYTGETQPIYRWYQLPIDTYYYCDACQDAQYKWVNLPISQDWECVGTTKYYKQKKQVSVDGGSTWTDVVPPQYQRGALYEQNSSSCGYRTRTSSGSPYCDGYDKYVDVYSQYSTDGGNTWQTTATTPTMVEHNSEYCGYIEPQYRTTSGDTYCSGYNKYVPVYNQVSYDGGITWTTTAATEVLVESYSQDCGYVPLTRWVESGWTCVGYDKYVNNVQQISYDDGQTWQNTSNTSASTLIESYSTDCGVMYRWTDSDVTVCSGVNKYYLAYKEMSLNGGQTWTEVSPRVTSLGTLVESTSMDCTKLWAYYSDGNTYATPCDSSTYINRDTTRPSGYNWLNMTHAKVGNCVTELYTSAFGETPNGGSYEGYSACTALTDCVLGNSITRIGQRAFYKCSSLTGITIPDSVVTIENSAFQNCSALRECHIGSGVTSIPNSCFLYCVLTGITIPDSVTSIGSDAFNTCRLTSVTIGTGVTYIGSDAFANNWSLGSVTILATTPPTLGGGVFINGGATTTYPIYVPCESVIAYKSAWSSLASRIQGIPPCTLPSKFKAYYSNGTTYNAECDGSTTLTGSTVKPSGYQYTAMTRAEIGDCVYAIGDSTFGGCRGLTSVTMGDNVQTIGMYSFKNCSSLPSIEIPSGLTSIGYQCFYSGSSLTSITFEQGSQLQDIDSMAFANTSLRSISIPSGVTSIGSFAFEYCKSLTSVTIPNSATNIGNGAFTNCTSLTSIDVPDSVTSIGNQAFYRCSGLTSITVNATTPPTLGGSALDSTNNCPIYVPSGSVETYKAASGWSDYASRIQAIQPTIQTKWIATYSDSHTESAECDSTSAITSAEINKTNLVSAEIGDCVTSIGNDAFRDCTGLTSCTIGSGVTSIGERSFQYCSSFTSIDIPSGVTSIAGAAFDSCTGLTSIDIPNSVTSIGESAFGFCSSLTSIDIPDSVTSIGDFVFYGCRSLTSVTVNATTPPTLGEFAFDNTNNCPIYVPAASVETYKSASGWSSYASRIQAIP